MLAQGRPPTFHFSPITSSSLPLCVLASWREIFFVLFFVFFAPLRGYWLLAIREALFPNSEHGQLFLIDQRAGHRDRSVTEQEQG